MLRRLMLTTVLASITTLSYAAEHTVKMLNQNTWGTMVFEPSFLQVEVGDTVTFEPTDPGHNAATINYMMPWKGNRYRGEISKPITMTINKAGFYGVACTPHLTMGMVMIIQAGDGDIAEFKIPKTLPKQAKLRFNAIKGYVASN